MNSDIDALGLERGHRTLTVLGRIGKIATVPLAPRTAPAIDVAAGERLGGVVFLRAAFDSLVDYVQNGALDSGRYRLRQRVHNQLAPLALTRTGNAQIPHMLKRSTKQRSSTGPTGEAAEGPSGSFEFAPSAAE
jgi:hypothetical protein